jgi:hypothetical protein
MASYEAFRPYELPVFNLHPERDRVVWLHPRGRVPIDVEDRIGLEAFLAAHGALVSAEIVRDRIAEQALALADDVLRDVDRTTRALRVLNGLAQDAARSLRSEPLDRQQRRDGELMDLIERFAADGHLSHDDGRLVFPDETSRFFVNGGWFERYVYEQVWRLRIDRPHIQDLGRNIEVRREVRGQTVRNEIDVAFLADNRLHLIECKTRRWGGPEDDGSGAHALYKLDSLTDLLGGLQARGMLVSYQDLPNADRRRAADLGIHACAGREVRRLGEFLRSWVA